MADPTDPKNVDPESQNYWTDYKAKKSEQAPKFKVGWTEEDFERYRQMIDWERTAYLMSGDAVREIEEKLNDIKTDAKLPIQKKEELTAPLASALVEANADRSKAIDSLIGLITDLENVAKEDIQDMTDFLERGGDEAMEWVTALYKQDKTTPQKLIDYHSKIVGNFDMLKNTIQSGDWGDLWNLASSATAKSGAFKTKVVKDDFASSQVFFDKLIKHGVDPELAGDMAKEMKTYHKPQVGEVQPYDPKEDAPFIIAMDYLTSLELARQGLGMSRVVAKKQKGLRPGPREVPKSAIDPTAKGKPPFSGPRRTGGSPKTTPKSDVPNARIVDGKLVIDPELESVDRGVCPVCESEICRCCSTCGKPECTCKEDDNNRIKMISDFID